MSRSNFELLHDRRAVGNDGRGKIERHVTATHAFPSSRAQGHEHRNQARMTPLDGSSAGNRTTVFRLRVADPHAILGVATMSMEIETGDLYDPPVLHSTTGKCSN